jgi:hypothetical protein
MLEVIIGTMFAVFILLVTVGGFEMILSFGNVRRLERSKRQIEYSNKGFAIILCSWLIINTVMHMIGAENKDSWWMLEF